MCEQWLDGVGGTLWQNPLPPPPALPLLTRKRDPEPHDLHLTPKATRTISNTTQEKEGLLSKDCPAFLKEPLGPNSETVAEEMRDGHPRPSAEDVSLATTPSFSLVQEALLSFDPDSAAGPSGFRPRHQGRAHLGVQQRSVVGIMAEGHIPAPSSPGSPVLHSRGIEEEGWQPSPSGSGRDSSTPHGEGLAGRGDGTLPLNRHSFCSGLAVRPLPTSSDGGFDATATTKDDAS